MKLIGGPSRTEYASVFIGSIAMKAGNQVIVFDEGLYVLTKGTSLYTWRPYLPQKTTLLGGPLVGLLACEHIEDYMFIMEGQEGQYRLKGSMYEWRWKRQWVGGPFAGQYVHKTNKDLALIYSKPAGTYLRDSAEEDFQWYPHKKFVGGPWDGHYASSPQASLTALTRVHSAQGHYVRKSTEEDFQWVPAETAEQKLQRDLQSERERNAQLQALLTEFEQRLQLLTKG